MARTIQPFWLNSTSGWCTPQSVFQTAERAVRYPENIELIVINPNPASDFVIIQRQNQKLEALSTEVFEVFDLNGRLRLSFSLSDESNQVDISVLPNGIYFFTISGFRQVVGKMIVSKN